MKSSSESEESDSRLNFQCIQFLKNVYKEFTNERRESYRGSPPTPPPPIMTFLSEYLMHSIHSEVTPL